MIPGMRNLTEEEKNCVFCLRVTVLLSQMIFLVQLVIDMYNKPNIHK